MDYLPDIGSYYTQSLSKTILWISITFRVFNSLVVKTSFNPDEYWQSLEVAHDLAFGYGYKTWEWNSKWRIRSWLHPVMFSILYRILALFRYDTPWLVAYAPRIFQGVIAGITDWSWFRASSKLSHSKRIGLCTWFCCILNWFLFFCSTRTFSNCMETLFVALALSRWPFDNTHSSHTSLFCAAIAFLFRPTAAIFFILPGLQLLYNSEDRRSLIFGQVFPLAIFALGFTLLLDSHFYGKWTFAFYNFLNFNLVHQGSALYGTHPFHYYFLEGIFSVLGPMIVLSILGVYNSDRDTRFWLYNSIFVMCVLSLSPHKELRFLLPVLGIWLCFAGKGLYYFELKDYRNGCLTLLLIINAPAAYYFSQLHQRGTIEVMEFFRNLDEPIDSIHFLTNCHATPLHSHLHSHYTEVKILDCSPHFVNGSLTRAGTQEANFLKDPLSYVRDFYDAYDLPQFIVAFKREAEVLQSFLKHRGFEVRKEIFHSHLEEPSIVVFERNMECFWDSNVKSDAMVSMFIAYQECSLRMVQEGKIMNSMIFWTDAIELDFCEAFLIALEKKSLLFATNTQQFRHPSVFDWEKHRHWFSEFYPLLIWHGKDRNSKTCPNAVIMDLFLHHDEL